MYLHAKARDSYLIMYIKYTEQQYCYSLFGLLEDLEEENNKTNIIMCFVVLYNYCDHGNTLPMLLLLFYWMDSVGFRPDHARH